MQWLERHHKEDFFLWIDAWDPPEYYTELYWPEDGGDVVMPSRAELSVAELPEDKRGFTWVGGRLASDVEPTEKSVKRRMLFIAVRLQ